MIPNTILLSVYVLNIYLILDSIEILMNFNPHYSPKGLMSLNRITVKRVKSKFLFLLGTFKYNKAIIYFRVILSFLLFLDYKNLGFVLFFLFMIELYLRYNFIDSVSGSGGIVLFNLFVLSIFYSFNDPRILHLITINLIVAYVSNGIKKLQSPRWRNGTGIRDMMKTNLFGNKILDGILNNNINIFKVLSWFIMLFQATFFLSLLNINFLAIYLFLGICFHIFVAVVFRLYDFLISFISAYPILIFTFFVLHPDKLQILKTIIFRF